MMNLACNSLSINIANSPFKALVVGSSPTQPTIF